MLSSQSESQMYIMHLISCVAGAIICCWLVLATLVSVSWYFSAGSTPCSSDGNTDQKLTHTPCSVLANKGACPNGVIDDYRLSDFMSPSVNKVCVYCCQLVYFAYINYVSNKISAFDSSKKSDLSGKILSSYCYHWPLIQNSLAFVHRW
jgi:hypothetical protein